MVTIDHHAPPSIQRGSSTVAPQGNLPPPTPHPHHETNLNPNPNRGGWIQDTIQRMDVIIVSSNV